MQRTIQFTDKNNNLIKLEINIKHSANKVNYILSICGECGGSSGQVYNDITPRTSEQSTILHLWEKYHLQPIWDEIITKIFTICKTIEEEEYYKLTKCDTFCLASKEVLNEYENQIIAVAMQLKKDGFSITKEMLDNAEVNGLNVTLGGREYICGSYNECENYAREYLKDNADELMGLYEVHNNIRQYIDVDAWVDDCIGDGLGHNLNRYNGREEKGAVLGVQGLQ